MKLQISSNNRNRFTTQTFVCQIYENEKITIFKSRLQHKKCAIVGFDPQTVKTKRVSDNEKPKCFFVFLLFYITYTTKL